MWSTVAGATINLDDIERFTVVATPSLVDDNLASISSEYGYDATKMAMPLHVNDVLVQSPSVVLNGQGGQIQNINIRGFSRWRIRSLVNGVPIMSDRRAGSSVGFVPPSLLESVQVNTGGAAVYAGSGTIGGAVNLTFADRLRPELRIGFDTNSSMRGYQYAGASDNVDVMVSHRSANNGSDARGNRLFDQFTQSTLFLRYNPQSSAHSEYPTAAYHTATTDAGQSMATMSRITQGTSPITSAWTLFSDNRDIGKSSSDFPQRSVTLYPMNKHWLGKIQFEFNTTDTDIDADLWWHTESLETQTVRPAQRVNESDSDAVDFGGSLRGHTLGPFTSSLIEEWDIGWQLQWHGRENVAINEAEFTIDALQAQQNQQLRRDEQKFLVFERKTLNAAEHNVSALLDASRTFKNTTYAMGARVEWQHQRNQSDSDVSLSEIRTQSMPNRNVVSSNLSGFVGVKHAFSRRLYSSLSVSTAFRTPSLVERFFSGETPRGQVLGNSSLRTEQATNIQSGVYFEGKRGTNEVRGAVEVFHQRISDYIERGSIDENTLTYSNLNSATIRGITYELTWQPVSVLWRFNAAGAWIDGKDTSGTHIADIPPRHAEISAHYTRGNTSMFGTLRYRASKTDVGDGERPLSDVYTIDMGATFSLGDNVSMSLGMRNATNQHFYTTADKRAAFAQGRSIQAALRLLL